jgi:catechol 2,3-dioxygenase-like lactoylglutathione lyase family enzyme
MTLKHISMISIPVTDQEKAKDFYVDGLGFTVTVDFLMDAQTAGSAGAGARWLMLTPPGGGADITLVTWFRETMAPGSAKLALACDNVDKTYAELTGRGITPNNEPQDAPWGRWFGVDDPDGNNWLISEPPANEPPINEPPLNEQRSMP